MRLKEKLQATWPPAWRVQLSWVNHRHDILSLIFPSFNKTLRASSYWFSPECWAWLGKADSHLLKPVLRLALACMGCSEQKQLLIVLSF